jgi:hypothetical protein
VVTGRRAILLAGAVTAIRRAAAVAPVPPDNALAFRLIRFGNEIGRHTVAFERQDDVLTVRVTVDALVSFLSIPLVRYRHRAIETWHGGTLVGLTGETDKNGQNGWMKARQTGEGLQVAGSKTAPYIAPEAATGTSYWNKRMLDGPMISLEDGVLLRPKVALLRTEPVQLASGAKVAAAHYNLSGVFDADVWYDQTETWVGLALTVADGSNIHYERL